MTEREENVEDSHNAAIEEMNLGLSELALESNRESTNAAEDQRKKEQEDDPEDDDETRITSNDLYQWEKVFLKEILAKCNRSYQLAALEDPDQMKEREKKMMKEGRLLIKDANEDDKKKIKSEESSSSSSRKGKEKMYEQEQKIDPLKLIRDIILGFYDYIDHIREMARERVKDEAKWDAHFEAGARVIEKLTDKMDELKEEIEGMKKRKDLKEKYVAILKMMSKLKAINACLDRCSEILIVSERDSTEIELELCENELKRCKKELRELTWDVMNSA